MDCLIRANGHTANIIDVSGEYRMLRASVNGPSYHSDERIMPYMEAVGFRLVALIHMFDLRANLISALVEQWRLKTHTFHLPYREYIITLEDATLQLGLLINGSAATGTSKVIKPVALCYHLLGRSLVMIKIDLRV
ncbi:hypothetical protein PVK06_004332 [Gossypium arboreum]|uniref:Aminotransferase-like plant mobile domain-containing protein n=1 Tax=Gossypium arboreum TaxID=29729 RepID=A0ABR0QRP8_GOSAR|nr:hypothetical protein PVK06_004332 [Gossypium arboreum]